MGDATDRELHLLHAAYGCIGAAGASTVLMVAARIAGEDVTMGIAAGITLVFVVAVLALWVLLLVSLRRDDPEDGGWWPDDDPPVPDPLPILEVTADYQLAA